MHDEHTFNFACVGDFQDMHSRKPSADGHVATYYVLGGIHLPILYYWVYLPVTHTDARVKSSQVRK